MADDPGASRAEVYQILEAVERRFDDLRQSDIEAVKLRHEDLTMRLEGFPQQFATKIEMEEAARSLQRLEKDALSREVYEQNHQAVVEGVAKMEREKLPESVFTTFIDNYRIEQDRAAQERRDVAQVLATATHTVRAQVLEERGDYLTLESYEQQHSALVHQMDAVERWQYKLIGALVFATFIAPLVTGTVVYIITKGIS